ncbi:MAG: GPP34 family phosphoprotein [Acetobacteraceae bacterium]|nr:GPP34 family phosphoprotein [Acetobacteraceae bacterium]
MSGLSLPEEITLLTLDDETGRSVGRQGLAAALALSGAVMMELALAHRVDTDRDRLEVLDTTPAGDPVLDAGLAAIAGSEDSRAALLRLSREEGLRPMLLDRLVGAGLLRRVEGRVLLVFPERRYLKPEDRPEPREVRARLLRAVEGDHIPEPREALLFGLARAVALLPALLPAPVLAARQDRMDLLLRIEALNRSLAEIVGDIYAARLRSGGA